MNSDTFLGTKISDFQTLNYNECLHRSCSQIRQESWAQYHAFLTSYTGGMCLFLRTNKWIVRLFLEIVQGESSTTCWWWYFQYLFSNLMFPPFIWKQNHGCISGTSKLELNLMKTLQRYKSKHIIYTPLHLYPWQYVQIHLRKASPQSSTQTFPISKVWAMPKYRQKQRHA